MKPGAGLVAALLFVSALGVARTQPRLAQSAHDAKEKDEIYAFPPPATLKAAVLGYDAAAVDLLWAKLLVEFGIHWHEKREFHADPFIEAILYLEPTYDRVYRFADTLLCYHPLHANEADARKTRAILERGTRERPWDYEVWQEYGQFSAFLGPGFLTKDDEAAERDRWRREGALAMAKASDLGARGFGALIAATMLERYGEHEAAIEALERQYAAHDDPDERAEIQAKIDRLKEGKRFAVQASAIAKIDAIGADWRFLTKDQFLLLGPFPDPALCAGLAASGTPECPQDWDAVINPKGAAPQPEP